MDYDREINQLAGGTMALQALLSYLCRRLANAGLRDHVSGAFEDAASWNESAGVLKA